MANVKEGVIFWPGMHPVWKEFAVEAIDRVSRRLIGRPAFITSARDSKHSQLSDHYSGCAIDLRTRDLLPATRQRYADELQEELGSDFWVKYESTPRPVGHVHISYRGA